jgi:hypothetical protein
MRARPEMNRYICSHTLQVVIADRTDVRDNLRMFLTFDLKLHSLQDYEI